MAVDTAGLIASVRDIFADIKAQPVRGQKATYIPLLSEASDSWFAVAGCTVDGTAFAFGDTDIAFSLQSCVNCLVYAKAFDDLGPRKVHSHIGYEPSGGAFNAVELNADRLPHNPLTNAGAIVLGSLFAPQLEAAAKFRYLLRTIQAMAGNRRPGFSHSTYLCEHETAWRNQALVAFMQDAGVFPPGSNPTEALDFYLQSCSVTVGVETAAAIAATLANGGVSPTTGQRVLSSSATKHTLALMLSCGMYDYSGTWMSQVGLPAKSGVSGLIYVVVPRVMGLAIFSPPLDAHGNSVRGIEFAARLAARHRLGMVDQLYGAWESGSGYVVRRPLVSAGGHSRGSGSVRDALKPAGLAALERLARVARCARLVTAWHAHNSGAETGGLTLAALHAFLTAGAGLTLPPLEEHASASSSSSYSGGGSNSGSSSSSSPLEAAWAALVASVAPRAAARGHALADAPLTLRTLLLAQGLPAASSTTDRPASSLLRALSGGLAVPAFRAFAATVAAACRAVAAEETSGTVFSKLPIEELTGADGSAFGVSIVSVDGQVLHIGDTEAEFPLMGTVRPLLYALACKDAGVGEVHRWVGEEPTAADPATFTLMAAGAAAAAPATTSGGATAAPAAAAPPPHPRPFNPFLDSGALAVCSLLGRAHLPPEERLFHDSGSRFSRIVGELTALCGGRSRVGFNNACFLAQKQKRLKTLAISYYMKGMGAYPANADPTTAAHTLFQAEALEMSTRGLAAVAATLANKGVCPLSGEGCLPGGVMRSTLSLMYNSGMCQATGRWAFLVGVPASTGVSGATMLVVPGVMGIAIYSPRLNEVGVPPRALRLAQALATRYRISIFDRIRRVPLDGRPDWVDAASGTTSGDAASSAPAASPTPPAGGPSLGWSTPGAASGPSSSPAPYPPSSSAASVLATMTPQQALALAAARGDPEGCAAALAAGADPNAADYDGRTPLHTAVRASAASGAPASGNHARVVSLLLAAGAGPGKKDRWGRPALEAGGGGSGLVDAAATGVWASPQLGGMPGAGLAGTPLRSGSGVAAPSFTLPGPAGGASVGGGSVLRIASGGPAFASPYQLPALPQGSGRRSRSSSAVNDAAEAPPPPPRPAPTTLPGPGLSSPAASSIPYSVGGPTSGMRYLQATGPTASPPPGSSGASTTGSIAAEVGAGSAAPSPFLTGASLSSWSRRSSGVSVMSNLSDFPSPIRSSGSSVASLSLYGGGEGGGDEDAEPVPITIGRRRINPPVARGLQYQGSLAGGGRRGSGASTSSSGSSSRLLL